MNDAHTVYLIDDDEAVLESLSALLKTAEIETQTYLTAEDFLNDYHKDARGCVVTDLRLTGGRLNPSDAADDIRD